MPSSKALRRAGALVGLAIFAFLLWRLAPHSAQLNLAWRRLDAMHLALGFVGVMAAQLAFAASWHRLLRAAGEAHDFAGDAARWNASLAGKYLPGKVWQAVARYGLYHGSGRSARVAPAYAREMLLGLSAAMAWVAVGTPGTDALSQVLRLAFAGGALVLAALAAPGLGLRAIAVLARWLPGRLQLADARGGVMVAAWAWQVGAHACLGLGLFALGHGLGWFSATQAPLAIAAMCFGGLAGIAALFVPAGIGVREAAMAWFLAPAIGTAPAMMLAVLARAWISIGEGLAIAAGLWWLQRHSGVLREHTR